MDKLSQSINNLEVKVNDLGSKHSAILGEVKMLRTRNIELKKQIEDKGEYELIWSTDPKFINNKPFEPKKNDQPIKKYL